MGYNEIEADCQYLHFVQRRKRVGVWREFYRHTKNTCATDFGRKSLVKWHNTSFKRRRRRRRRRKKKEEEKKKRRKEEKFTHHRTLRGVFLRQDICSFQCLHQSLVFKWTQRILNDLSWKPHQTKWKGGIKLPGCTARAMDSEESKQNRDRTKYSCHTIIHLHRVCDFQNDSCLVSLYPKVRSMPEPGTVVVVAAMQKNKKKQKRWILKRSKARKIKNCWHGMSAPELTACFKTLDYLLLTKTIEHFDCFPFRAPSWHTIFGRLACFVGLSPTTTTTSILPPSSFH